MADVPERVRRAGRHPPRRHGGPGRGGLHAVLHPPPRRSWSRSTFWGDRPGHREPSSASWPARSTRLRWCPAPRRSIGRGRHPDRRQIGLPRFVRSAGVLRQQRLPANRPPSSSGLGHRPFTAAARVRIPLGVLFWFRPGACVPPRDARVRRTHLRGNPTQFESGAQRALRWRGYCAVAIHG